MKHEEIIQAIFGAARNITELEVALLLNFKEATLTWKRVVR